MSRSKCRAKAAPVSATNGWRIPASLAILIGVAFYPSLKIPFLYDDYQIYLDHWPDVSWAALIHDLTSHFQQNRILAHLTWYLQLIIDPARPPEALWFHLVNLAIHFLNSLLVVSLVRALGATDAVSYLTGCLFAVHPGNMEAVAYLYGRSDLQITALILGSLLLLGRPANRMGILTALAVLAVLTKETVVVLPALYLLSAGLLRAVTYPIDRRALAFTLAVAAAGVAAFVFLKTDHADNFGYSLPDAGRYLLLQPFVLMLGLLRLVVPWGFSILYQFDLPSGIADPRVIGCVLVWMALVWPAVHWYRRGDRFYLFSLGWYVAAMAPTNSIVPRIDQLSDRHLYLASIGPLWALSHLIDRLRARVSRDRGRLMVWAAVGTCVILTMQRNLSWQSPVDLWTTTVRRFPNSHLAHRELAAEWGRAGNSQTELETLDMITRQWPQDWTSWNNLGIAYAALGRRREEQTAYRHAIDNAPRRHQSLLHHNLAFSLQNDGQIDLAMAEYRQASELDPTASGSMHNLAVLLWTRGQLIEASRLLETVLDLQPHMDLARRNLAMVLIDQGRAAEARPHLEKIQHSNSFGADARQLLAKLESR